MISVEVEFSPLIRSLERREVLLNDLHDNLMIFLHRQPTDHDHTHYALHILHANRETTTMDCILARTLAEHELGAERVLVSLELVVQEPGARAPAQDRSPLARDPRIVVRGGPACGGAVKEQLRVRGERDVHHRGLGGRLLETGAEARSKLPGGVGGKVGEDAALLFVRDGIELWIHVSTR